MVILWLPMKSSYKTISGAFAVLGRGAMGLSQAEKTFSSIHFSFSSTPCLDRQEHTG